MEIAQAQAASRDVYEAEEVKRKAQERQQREKSDVFEYPKYRESLVLRRLRERADLKSVCCRACVRCAFVTGGITRLS